MLVVFRPKRTRGPKIATGFGRFVLELLLVLLDNTIIDLNRIPQEHLTENEAKRTMAMVSGMGKITFHIMNKA